MLKKIVTAENTELNDFKTIVYKLLADIMVAVYLLCKAC